MLDRGTHPRFAIGESSTPLADFLLEQLADSYGLPELKPLCRWGSWQATYPHLQAGKKRGFSYFSHQPGEEFRETASYQHSLLVAASVDDARSDTHWMRSDVDAWMCQLAEQAGVRWLDHSAAQRVLKTAAGWRLEGSRTSSSKESQPWSISCQFLVDATGGSGWLAQQLQLSNRNEQLRVRTGALFGHFSGVGAMHEVLMQQGLPVEEDPFDADDAAQHHLLGTEGWSWMLRFGSGVTSVGLVCPSEVLFGLHDPLKRWSRWGDWLRRYPTLSHLMADSRLIAPQSPISQAASGVELGWIPRISRLWGAAAGQGWAMLPSTAGVVDPLHSTGIAHTLSGVQRLLEMLAHAPQSQPSSAALDAYSTQVVSEILWIDAIVDVCYIASRRSFSLFTAMCSLYFVAAIHCERALANRSSMTTGFLCCGSTELQQLCEEARLKLQRLPLENTDSQAELAFIDWLRQRLAPWNDVGLLDPASRNRIARSAAPK
ncbi:hypothetical protein Q31a_04260 [Aureliella helgolandensis]|uniref:Tryptophan halogenase n=2 Tax=Aureliella helgolandensis TaxID=2527968 RepID=A0A518G0L6_9BACT|nr:tryptophan 7-halogenase [Aureliella helgolandensis]QDV22143.1 hypothetical protein Q31a_04260 [Aureliella helgolandensis]